MKKGDIVEIYEQPLTETKPEGKAKLISFLAELAGGMEHWRVKFLSDGAVVYRFIKDKSEDEEAFLFCTKFQIQQTAMRTIGRKLKPKEMKYLREKIFTEIEKLAIKINSSGIGQ